jgi:(p)ppGpp synthase/HD superfamily hydrolase
MNVTKYSLKDRKEIERAIIFLVKKIQERCYNEKPLILHSIRVGVQLIELCEEKETIIAGFLHDLLEDTDCKIVEIEKKFGKKVAKLVLACTFDKNIKDYKERWQKSVSNIKRGGTKR